MRENPYSDGKVRNLTDGIIRGVIIGTGIAVVWNIEVVWYWKIAIFMAFMFVLGLIYPAVQFALVKRKHRKRIDAENAGDAEYQTLVKQLHPEIAAETEQLRDWQATMSAITEAHKTGNGPPKV